MEYRVEVLNVSDLQLLVMQSKEARWMRTLAKPFLPILELVWCVNTSAPVSGAICNNVSLCMIVICNYHTPGIYVYSYHPREFQTPSKEWAAKVCIVTNCIYIFYIHTNLSILS